MSSKAILLNPLPNDNILEVIKFKALADDNIKCL